MKWKYNYTNMRTRTMTWHNNKNVIKFYQCECIRNYVWYHIQRNITGSKHILNRYYLIPFSLSWFHVNNKQSRRWRGHLCTITLYLFQGFSFFFGQVLHYQDWLTDFFSCFHFSIFYLYFGLVALEGSTFHLHTKMHLYKQKKILHLI